MGKTKKELPTAIYCSGLSPPSGSLLPEAVDELPNEHKMEEDEGKRRVTACRKKVTLA